LQRRRRSREVSKTNSNWILHFFFVFFGYGGYCITVIIGIYYSVLDHHGGLEMISFFYFFDLFLCCVFFTHLLQFHVAYFSFIYTHHVFDKMLLWMLIIINITKYDFLFFSPFIHQFLNHDLCLIML
jgi:hypothetical protein